LLFEETGNLRDMLLQSREARVLPKHGKLKVEHEEIETFGLFVLALDVGREPGYVFRQLVQVVFLQRAPHVSVCVALDKLSLRSDDEVVGVHRCDDTVEE
jgi:hypothetical protein